MLDVASIRVRACVCVRVRACVCVRARVRACACVLACACVRERAGVRAGVRACQCSWGALACMHRFAFMHGAIAHEAILMHTRRHRATARSASSCYLARTRGSSRRNYTLPAAQRVARSPQRRGHRLPPRAASACRATCHTGRGPCYHGHPARPRWCRHAPLPATQHNTAHCCPGVRRTRWRRRVARS